MKYHVRYRHLLQNGAMKDMHGLSPSVSEPTENLVARSACVALYVDQLVAPKLHKPRVHEAVAEPHQVGKLTRGFDPFRHEAEQELLDWRDLAWFQDHRPHLQYEHRKAHGLVPEESAPWTGSKTSSDGFCVDGHVVLFPLLKHAHEALRGPSPNVVEHALEWLRVGRAPHKLIVTNDEQQIAGA